MRQLQGSLMEFKSTYVPYGLYWSSPFVRWQGSLANQHAIYLAAGTANHVFENWEISPEIFDSIHFGITVPQKHAFYGQTWFAGLIGAPEITGPMLAQACATSARVIASAATELEVAGNKRVVLAVTCDRTSNGPHILYPNPIGPGGKGSSEDWVLDNFGYDPYAKKPMIQTAENVAKEAGITRDEQEEMTLLRYKQYEDALVDDSAFLRRFMVIPVEVKEGRKIITIEGDEGVFPTTAEGLAKLKPVIEGGTVTYGTQTHPADGNCGMILTSREKAQELSHNKDFEVQVLSYGQARAKKGFMPMATVPAAKNALESTQLTVGDVTAFKLHNPFALNDVYFCREFGIDPKNVNNYGSSLVWGHPQAPMGMRLVMELIEELAINDGGYGLFSGCAAGDTASAIVVEVTKA